MAQSKIMHGARALVSIDGKIVGLFTNVSYGSSYDVQPAFTLGRYSATELAYTGAEPIGISATGFRVVNAGPYQPSSVGGTGMPTLQQLLSAEDMTFSIADRQTGKTIMTVTQVKHSGFNTSIAPKQLEEMTLNFVGLKISDESATNEEGGGVLPPATLP